VEPRTFQRVLRLSGTLEAVRFSAILAPELAGGGDWNMVITKLASAGTRVNKGDLLAEFDRQAQIRTFLDQQAEYRDFENQIASKKAEQEAAKAQDDTDLKTAEDAVGTAKLEVLRSEVVSRIDAEKNKLNLEAAEANLKQLRQTYELKRKAAQADLRILEIKAERSRSAMLHAQQNSEKLTIRSPIDGLVVLNPIWKGSGMGEVQEGDQVWAGEPFMQVVDPSIMEVRVRVNQLDVAYLHVGQPATIHLDAYPDLKLPGRLEQLAAIGLSGGLSKTVRAFGAVFSIQGSDPRALPDLSAAVDVEVGREPGVLVVPRDAVVVAQDGKSWVWVKGALGFEKRAVETGDSNDLEVVITSGLEPGMEIERHSGAGPYRAALRQPGGDGSSSESERSAALDRSQTRKGVTPLFL
jgi:multidrug efflux pump subunit AcrA (membrane-fusion protein)